MQECFFNNPSARGQLCLRRVKDAARYNPGKIVPAIISTYR